MSEPERETDACRPVEIDGEIIRVRGSSDMSDESRAALTEVIRAAKRKFAAEHPGRLTVDTITSDQLDALQDRLWTAEQRAAAMDRLWSEFGKERARAERAEAAIARVRAVLDRADRARQRLRGNTEPMPIGVGMGLDDAAKAVRAALDEPKEPTT